MKGKVESIKNVEISFKFLWFFQKKTVNLIKKEDKKAKVKEGKKLILMIESKILKVEIKKY